MANNPSRIHAYIEHLPTTTEALNLRAIFRPLFGHIANLEDKLIALFPQLNQGKVDNPFQQPNTMSNQVPPQVKISVRQKAGISYVQIQLPQLDLPATKGLYGLLADAGPNAPQSFLFHRVQSASDSSFDDAASVQNYETPQLIFSFPDANSHWRIQSSFDTKNFNDFTAPQMAVLLP